MPQLGNALRIPCASYYLASGFWKGEICSTLSWPALLKSLNRSDLTPIRTKHGTRRLMSSMKIWPTYWTGPSRLILKTMTLESRWRSRRVPSPRTS